LLLENIRFCFAGELREIVTDLVRKLFGFLRKLFGLQQATQPGDEDADLTKFYTDSEHALQVFEQLVTTSNLLRDSRIINCSG